MAVVRDVIAWQTNERAPHRLSRRAVSFQAEFPFGRWSQFSAGTNGPIFSRLTAVGPLTCGSESACRAQRQLGAPDASSARPRGEQLGRALGALLLRPTPPTAVFGVSLPELK